LFNIISGEDVKDVYEKAIRNAMSQWNKDGGSCPPCNCDEDTTIIGDPIEEYLSQEEIALTGEVEKDFEKISTQFWISTLPNAYNAWTNIRRTGYPVIPQRTSPILEKGVTNGYMPTRMLYPTTGELSNNEKNLQEAIDRLPGGEDKIDLKVWWDVRDAIEN
jgi:hypothetical protein